MTDAVPRILLIVGAGASTLLGRDAPLPMMGEWGRSLAADLDLALPGSAQALALDAPMNGEQFEENLGLFLHWLEALPLAERFLPFGGPQINTLSGDMQAWIGRTRDRSNAVRETLAVNLYRNFGVEAVSAESAERAYAALDTALGGAHVSKMCATTNYDPALRLGFSRNGYLVRDGFRSDSQWSTAYFEPSQLGNWGNAEFPSLPVMHLHGAVGWYRDANGRVFLHPADRAYMSNLGSPVFLPPDPTKDPLNDTATASLWQEFRTAVSGSTHVIVLGHSLHDRFLVSVLESRPRDVCLLIASKHVDASVALLPGAETLEMEFGPNIPIPSSLHEWIDS